jgi:hypothetical protein
VNFSFLSDAVDRTTLEKAQNSGVEFLGRIKTPYGKKNLVLTVDDVIALTKDKNAFSARHFGGTAKDYLTWIKFGGSPRCGGRTKAGNPCRNFVSGAILFDFDEWRDLDLNEYCAVHGGPASHKR